MRGAGQYQRSPKPLGPGFEQPGHKGTSDLPNAQTTVDSGTGTSENPQLESDLSPNLAIKSHPLTEMMESVRHNNLLSELRLKMAPHVRELEEIRNKSAAMQKVFADIEEQKKRLGAMHVPLSHSSKSSTLQAASPLIPKIPPNPILKTNQKLGDIELKFDEMLSVMTSAASIATEIQGHAAHFLDKFDKASEQTDKAARGAIRVAMLAMALSVVTALLPVAMTYIQPDPMPQKIDALVESLAQNQAASQALNEQLLRDLAVTNASATSALLEGLAQRDRELKTLIQQLHKDLIVK